MEALGAQRRQRERHAVLTVLLAVALATQAWAAGAGAVALQFNTSARASGMGGAGVANVWGGDTNVWANPALLAFRPGVRYSHMYSQLVPDLADDIEIDTQELTFGYAGIGLLYALAPFDHVYLDMGEQTITDENGQEIGTFSSWEKSRSFGLGVGVTQVTDRFFDTQLNRWFDVGLGYVWRKYEDRLAPDAVIQDSGGGATGEASSHDYGLVAQATPLNTLTHFKKTADLPVGFVAEATYGWAKTNATDEYIVHVDQDQSDPMPTAYQEGWAVRAAVIPGRDFMNVFPDLLRESLTPLFAWTYSEQTEVPGYVWRDNHYVYDRDDNEQHHVKMRGTELLFLNLVYLRKGHYRDPLGQIDDGTVGWGVNLQVGRLGGFRYDNATVPQATGLDKVEREGWHVWVDVMAILERY